METDPLLLPASPSALLRHGLADLVECEKDDRYIVDMLFWHRYSPADDKCKIDLAGAFLAKTLKVPYTRNVLPCELSRGWDEATYALMNFQRGTIDYSMQALGYRTQFGVLRIPTYKTNRDAFHKSMKWIASELEKRGV